MTAREAERGAEESGRARVGLQRGDGGSGHAALRGAGLRLRRVHLGEGLPAVLRAAAGDQRTETCERPAEAAAKSDLV